MSFVDIACGPRADMLGYRRPRPILERRTGFKQAWQKRDYAAIVAVAVRIPDKVLQEDPVLLLWHDQAVTRAGET